MLNALEEDPDEKHRWRRFGTGAAVALGVTTVLVYSANQYAPTRELMQRVVQMTVHVPPPEVEEKPLPPLPPPPPKPQPKKQEKEQQAKKEPAPKPDANPQQADPTQVGMDSQSFAEGGSGPGFRVGGNQMGDPNVVVPASVSKPAAPATARKPQRIEYLMAKPLRKGANTDALFNARARKLGLSGLMVMELDIDSRGRVRSIKMRRGLEPKFDREVMDAVKTWEFEAPRSLGANQAIASARMLRLRFTLSD